jgi:hypothetical protein
VRLHEGETLTLLGALESASLSHWTESSLGEVSCDIGSCVISVEAVRNLVTHVRFSVAQSLAGE